MAQLNVASGSVVQVQDHLYEFVRDEALKGTRWTVDEVFGILGELVEEFGHRLVTDIRSQEIEGQKAIQEELDSVIIRSFKPHGDA